MSKKLKKWYYSSAAAGVMDDRRSAASGICRFPAHRLMDNMASEKATLYWRFCKQMKEKLIEIKQDRPGFDHFIGSWFCRNNVSLLVDVGPANTAARLLESLEELGIQEVDYILLTHIHIDHAGALADVLARYPMARVVCHEKGISNLVDPSRLWAGSLDVLGEIAQFYGEPKGVAENRIIPHTACAVNGLRVIETPGHAAHHLSFAYEGRLFSGEAAGNFLMVNGKEYLRPATPPRFFLHVFLESVDRLLALEDQPICYAHFGKAESSHRMLSRFREQVLSWESWIREEFSRGEENLEKRSVGALLAKDLNLEAFVDMDAATKQREKNFIANAVRGFIGYFRESRRETGSV
ncbi:MAG TPA: MBL fold metallo-hydrolase [Desulfobacteraceae bacterium]|nr:MBL fold metallo-hydrolase [Desulfobacteraceae bacterium]